MKGARKEVTREGATREGRDNEGDASDGRVSDLVFPLNTDLPIVRTFVYDFHRSVAKCLSNQKSNKKRMQAAPWSSFIRMDACMVSSYHFNPIEFKKSAHRSFRDVYIDNIWSVSQSRIKEL